MAQKSLFLSYTFWLFGGIFGLHHIYLNRDYQALVWCMTLGGMGLGWLRDLWRIPEYVKDANGDPMYMSQLAEKISKHDKPHTGFVRYAGMVLVADVLGLLASLAVPDYGTNNMHTKIVQSIVAPLGSALGVYLVGNIGRHEGRFVPLLSVLLTSPFYLVLDGPIFLSSMFASHVFNSYCKQWRRTPRTNKPFFFRAAFFILYGILYLLLLSSWLHFNCELTDANEESVRCSEAIMKDIYHVIVPGIERIWKILMLIYKNGLSNWHELGELIDPTGEMFAFLVLQVRPYATQEQISAQYKKLSLEWHPDRHKDPEAKKIAEAKFIRIQRAYEILSQKKRHSASEL